MVADKPHVAVAVAGRSEAVAAKTRRERIEQEAAAIGGRREHGIEADPEWIEQEPIPLLLARPTLGDLSCYLDSIGQVVGLGVDIHTSDAFEQIATVCGAFVYCRYADVGEPHQSVLVAVPSGSLHKRPYIVVISLLPAQAFSLI